MPRRTLIAMLLTLTAMCGARAACALEGRWAVEGGATFEVIASAGTTGALDIVWVDGADLTISPGTVVGTATPTADPAVYDGVFLTDPARGTARAQRHTFALRLTDADTLAFERYNSSWRFSPWRLIPYLFRIGAERPDRPRELAPVARRCGANPSFLVL